MLNKHSFKGSSFDDFFNKKELMKEHLRSWAKNTKIIDQRYSNPIIDWVLILVTDVGDQIRW